MLIQLVEITKNLWMLRVNLVGLVHVKQFVLMHTHMVQNVGVLKIN